MIHATLSIILLFVACASISLEQPMYQNKISVPRANSGVVHFSINVTNTQNAQSNNSTNLSAQQLAPQPPPEQPNFREILGQLWHENKKQLQEQSAHFFNSNKWYLLGASVLGSYSLLAYFIISGNRYLGDTNLWSSWRHELPMDQLLAIPQQQFAQELLREIQQRYTDATSIIDIARPLTTFLAMIEQEDEQLKWYQSVYSWLSYARLTKLVPLSQYRFSKIAERIARIAYYKNVFKSWAADYQFQQTQRVFYRSNQPDLPNLQPITRLLQIENRLKILGCWNQKKPLNTPLAERLNL